MISHSLGGVILKIVGSSPIAGVKSWTTLLTIIRQWTSPLKWLCTSNIFYRALQAFIFFGTPNSNSSDPVKWDPAYRILTAFLRPKLDCSITAEVAKRFFENAGHFEQQFHEFPVLSFFETKMTTTGRGLFSRRNEVVSQLFQREIIINFAKEVGGACSWRSRTHQYQVRDTCTARNRPHRDIKPDIGCTRSRKGLRFHWVVNKNSSLKIF